MVCSEKQQAGAVSCNLLTDTANNQQEIMLLKIPILTLNFPKIGSLGIKFCNIFTSAKEVMFLPVFVCLSVLAR